MAANWGQHDQGHQQNPYAQYQPWRASLGDPTVWAQDVFSQSSPNHEHVYANVLPLGTPLLMAAPPPSPLQQLVSEGMPQESGPFEIGAPVKLVHFMAGALQSYNGLIGDIVARHEHQVSEDTQEILFDVRCPLKHPKDWFKLVTEQEFRVTLHKDPRQRLGLDVDESDDGKNLTVADAGKEGVTLQWNRVNAGAKLAEGDIITEVNGVRGNAQAMSDACVNDDVLVMSLQRKGDGEVYPSAQSLQAILKNRMAMAKHHGTRGGGAGPMSSHYARDSSTVDLPPFVVARRLPSDKLEPLMSNDKKKTLGARPPIILDPIWGPPTAPVYMPAMQSSSSYANQDQLFNQGHPGGYGGMHPMTSAGGQLQHDMRHAFDSTSRGGHNIGHGVS